MNNPSNTYVAIMAGGIGSRFWPASRIARPKQFMDILGVGKSLIRLTFERFLHLCPAENIFIVTNGMYKELVNEHIPELTDNQILCEPSRNNTGPCVAYTAFKLNALNPDANFIVAPSDHVILKEEAFVSNLRKALSYTARQDAIVTLGIQPVRPDTGYGYINYTKEATAEDVHKVISFKEKPNKATAETYLKSGDYLWNAGIFVWSAKTILSAFKTLSPDIYSILQAGNHLYNTDQEQAFIDQAYPGTPNISVDYAILEKSSNVYTIPSDIGWSDLGTWASLHAEREQNAEGNVLQGQINAIEVNNSLVRMPKDKLAVIKGLDDYIIVDEEDVLLIWPKGEEQGIKGMLKDLREKSSGNFL
ncbi:MAG: mannose-1-phosphate guanylyltransferase [Bacteroidota bacterium]